MNASKSAHVIFTVATVGLLCLAMWLLLNGAPPGARADQGFLFVSPAGTGSSCSRSAPCALQTALNESGTGDTIFVAAGTYTGDGAAVITLTESINLRGGWNGAAAGPLVRQPLLYRSVLDGENERRVVYIAGGIAPVLDGFVVTNGDASHGLDPRHGGGIYGDASSPILTNNVIRNNVACSGTEYAYGGGIYLRSASESTLLAGNIIISNTANPATAGEGGGVSCRYGALTIRGNTFQDNVAGVESNSMGGGLHLEECLATVNHNLMRGNKAGSAGQGFGGGSFIERAEVTFSGNVVVSSTAKYGAVTFLGNPFITVTNNVIADNDDGLFLRGYSAFPLAGELAHNTLARNKGEGVYIGYYNSGCAELTLTNNIIVSHATGIYVYEDPTNHVTATHTLFYGNETDTGGGAMTSSDEIAGLDPRFANPDRLNYHLREDSPAIDAGIVVPWLRVDIDGDARPAGSGYDIGADEFVLRRVYLPLVTRGS